MNHHFSEGRYFGSCLKSRRAGPLLLTESTYAPGVEIPSHAHENSYFVFALSGSQEEAFGSGRRRYVPGTLAFHPAGEAHSERVGTEGMRCLHVEFGSLWATRHAEVSHFLERGAEFRGGRLGWLAQGIYREFRDMDEVAAAAIEGLMLEILADASRQVRTSSVRARPPWLVRARDLIHARFTQPLSLSDIASAVDVHPIHLSREFPRHFQCTVADYIRQLRIASACDQIATSNRPLADIAIEAGFSDQSHFTRVCKRLTGRTPGQFRNPREVC